MVPPPNASLVLVLAFVDAYLSTLTPKRRLHFLRRACENIATYRDTAKIRRIRSPEFDKEQADAIDAADEWLKQVLPLLMEAA